MHIPFYHRIGHGLYITETELFWAVLRRSGRDVTVQRVIDEPAADVSTQQALARLVDRVTPVPAFVATHLAPSHVRCFVVQRQRGEAGGRWRQETAQTHLPSGVSLEDFIVRARPIPRAPGAGPRGQQSYVFALAQRGAVQARIELLRSVDVEPVMVGDLRTDLGFAFAFDEAFIDRDLPLVLVHQDRGWVVRHREGSLVEAPEELGSNREGHLEEAVLHLADEGSDEPPPRLLVAGQGAEEALDRVGESLPFEVTPRAGIPQFQHALEAHQPSTDASAPSGVDAREAPSDERMADATPALAFAMKALYLDADPINFLAEEERHAARDRQDRQEVMQAGVLVGGILALLLLLVTGLNMYFERQASQAGQQLAQLDQQLTRVENAREERDRLRQQLQKSRALVVERTHAASLMDEVGQALPRGLWLDALEIARAENDSVSVRTAGFAVPEASVASYLSRLEQRPQLDQVQLGYSRVVSADDVFQRTGTYRRMLRRFEVHFVQASRGTTDPDARQRSTDTQ